MKKFVLVSDTGNYEDGDIFKVELFNTYEEAHKKMSDEVIGFRNYANNQDGEDANYSYSVDKLYANFTHQYYKHNWEIYEKEI